MIKQTILLMAALLAAPHAGAQEDDAAGDWQPAPRVETILPGKAGINVEKLKDTIDLGLDVQQLNLCEVRVLRNAFAARQGYPFKDAYLRGIFQTTTWYGDKMYDFDEAGENFNSSDGEDYDENEPWRDSYYRLIKPDAVRYTDQETAFIDKLKAREKQLLKENFKTRSGHIVNVDNIYNNTQLVDPAPELYERLGQKGFAIVPAKNIQMFHVYEKNDYANFPSFVTTDLFLQLYHLYFDCTLREVEENRLDSLLDLLCCRTHVLVAQKGMTLKTGRGKDAADWLKAFLTVANHLLREKPLLAASGKYAGQVAVEVQHAGSAQDALSPFLGFELNPFRYSLFRPRGHYTHSPQLERYFRTMMWLQTVPFGATDDDQLLRALLLAETIGGNAQLTALYKNITEPMTYLMGQPDNVDIMQVYGVLKASGLTAEGLLGNKEKLKQVRNKIIDLSERQTRIKSKFSPESNYVVNLMPQRYQPDAEVLQEMVDYDSEVTLRDTPKGLDFFAAMGVSQAERILINELHEDTRWAGYAPMLTKMKGRMGQTDWKETVVKQWMKTLQTVSQKTPQMPYFMTTDDWAKKDLNAMLASWAELKHDAILYAKMPMGAECGGGGPPEPVVRGYVEPNTIFWAKAADLLKTTGQVLRKYGLQTERSKNIIERIGEEAQFLLRISEKELAGKPLADQEYDQIAKIGSKFEYISLDLLRGPDNMYLSWNDVEGPSRNLALVADVYTANSPNNPAHSVLYEAVGEADEIYVVVEMGGMLYLTRGAVFSYREFKRPANDQRMNDEEWQEHLKEAPRDGVPSWMDDILLPLDSMPKPNELYFYSTGC